ncbi:MAG: Tll0287-like domain-containing protein [Gammaproteobacteria bacterium]
MIEHSAMKFRLELLMVCSLGAVLVTSNAVAGAGDMTDRDLAIEAVASFGGELKQALTDAMSSSGPVAAIDVCRLQAPAIAARISERTGLRVARTSARTRNSGNAASDWQIAVLDGWQAQRAQGEDLRMADYFEQRPDGGFRYMKPILTQPLCLTCHGAALSPGVEAALAESYPADRATGYAEGDIRGAFVVER